VIRYIEVIEPITILGKGSQMLEKFDKKVEKLEIAIVEKTIEIQKLKEKISKSKKENEKKGKFICHVAKLRMNLLVFKKY